MFPKPVGGRARALGLGRTNGVGRSGDEVPVARRSPGGRSRERGGEPGRLAPAEPQGRGDASPLASPVEGSLAAPAPAKLGPILGVGLQVPHDGELLTCSVGSEHRGSGHESADEDAVGEGVLGGHRHSSKNSRFLEPRRGRFGLLRAVWPRLTGDLEALAKQTLVRK